MTDWYVIFYNRRRKYNQDGLADHWQIRETKEEAIRVYNELLKRDDLKSAGIARLDPEFKTDWM